MIWVFLVLLASAIWAATNFIDKYLIEKYFTKKVGVLILFSSLISVLIIPIFLILDPSIIIIDPIVSIIIILNSFLLILYLFPYLEALRQEDVSTVAPLFQLIPVISIFLGTIFFKEILSPIQIFASFLIIFSSIAISLNLEKKIIFGLKTFFLMFLSSFMVALNSLVFKLFSIELGFFQIAFWQYVGFFIFSIFLLVFVKKYRVDFIYTIKKSGKKIISLNAVNEVINIFAQIIFYSTFTLAPIGLIWVLNGFQPFFILIFGVFLTVLFPKLIKEDISKKVLYKKAIFIVLLFFGGALLVINL